MIISIHGIPGSGKSKTTEHLLELLPGYSHTSTGAIARSIAAEHGFAADRFDSFPQYAREKNIPYDELIDNHLRELNQKGGDVIVDSRLGYFFLTNSFKVILNTKLRVAAKRIFNDPKRKGKYASVIEVYKQLLLREQSDKSKYLSLYGTDYTLKSNFDFEVQTIDRPQEVANMIFIEFGVWCSKR